MGRKNPTTSKKRKRWRLQKKTY